MKDLMEVLELGAIIAGSREAYKERPLINHHYCPVIPPLTMDVNSTEAVIYLTENRLPVYGTIVPNARVTSDHAWLILQGALNRGYLSINKGQLNESFRYDQLYRSTVASYGPESKIPGDRYSFL
jgi:hypothetical protein